MQNVNPGQSISLTAGGYTVMNTSPAQGQYAVSQMNPPLTVQQSIPGNATQSFTITAGGGGFENLGPTVLAVSPGTTS